MNSSETKLESIPEFTIIIPVIHSLEDIERCLSSLDKLDCPREQFQVVLVDCGVLEGLQQLFAERLERCSFRVTALTLPERPADSKSWLIEERINEARNFAIQRVSGQCYVFTEDDCMFETDWLAKFRDALTDDVGAVGGPDILPDGLTWLPRSLDCLLSSYLGSAGTHRGDGRAADEYYPRKENMAIPAKVLERIGKFPEDRLLGAEMEMANRMRDAGLRIKFLSDNPVWHRRITSFRNFIRVAAWMASEKVKLMRQRRTFRRSLHFMMLLAAIAVTVIAILSLLNRYAFMLLAGLVGLYFIAVLSTAVCAAVRTRSICVWFGMLLMMPFYHFGLTFGVIRGAVAKITAD
ncbi:MAG: glycosyltransferase [Planctomycetota bacterium]